MTGAHSNGIPATYMRGGTSKGIFLLARDLPPPGAERDLLLLRVMGSPDPYGKQINGLGGATSSTSKVVVVDAGAPPGCDVQYWFGQVAIDKPLIDWSGNCGNLTAAVAPFAITQGLVQVPDSGIAAVTLWQASIAKRIVAYIPIRAGLPLESGDFVLDGVARPGAEIELTFESPAAQGALFPTGNAVDTLTLSDGRTIEATLINAGNPTIIVRAETLGLTGIEHQVEVNRNPMLLAECEQWRAQAAVKMGLARSASEATTNRPSTPKLAFVAPPQPYISADGRPIDASMIDMTARILSMGALHHAMTGTGGVALAAAAALPGTVVSTLLGGPTRNITFGHPSGTTQVGALATQHAGMWHIDSVKMSRSARRLMTGVVHI